MAGHMWVELKMTPVEFDIEDNGTIHVHAREAAMDIADEEAQYGCWICFAPLDRDNLGTECIGGLERRVQDQRTSDQAEESPSDGSDGESRSDLDS